MSSTEEVPITPATNKQYVVIGGCGFLGRHIVEYLLKRGEKNIRVLDLRINKFSPVPEFMQGDITKMEDCVRAFQGAYCVFNTASPMHTGGEKLMYKVNVDGTKNVVEACQKVGVKQLVYTSSASVVFDGTPMKNVTEEKPYCKSYIDPYNKTKSIGERIVREANGKNGLSTVCIRPSGIFGPRDAQFFPGLIGVAKAKSLGMASSSFQLGDGSNYMDFTYVDNLVYAHVLASDKMTEGSAISGQVYFITNGEPRLFWATSAKILKDLGLTAPSIVIPYWLAFFLAYFIAICVWILSPIKTIHPNFTPFRLYNACNDRTFSIEKARRELGYKAYVSLDEGLRRTTEYFKKELAEGRI